MSAVQPLASSTCSASGWYFQTLTHQIFSSPEQKWPSLEGLPTTSIWDRLRWVWWHSWLTNDYRLHWCKAPKVETTHSPTGKVEMAKKLFRGFEGCHENALIQSFEMSPHLIRWEFRSKTFNGQPNPDPIQRLAIKGFGPELSTYQEGAHFEALDEGVLMVPLKSSEQFFRHFNFPCRTVRGNEVRRGREKLGNGWVNDFISVIYVFLCDKLV